MSVYVPTHNEVIAFLKDHQTHRGRLNLPDAPAFPSRHRFPSLDDLARWFSRICGGMNGGIEALDGMGLPLYGSNVAPVSGQTVWVKNLIGAWQNTTGTTPATASGDPVARWDDQSGNANNLLEQSANKDPSVSATTLNGYQGIVWPGSTTPKTALQVTGLSGVTGFSIYIVCTFTLSTSGLCLSGNSGAGQFWNDNSGNRMNMYDGTTMQAGNNPGTGAHYWSLIFNGNSSAMYKDGSQIVTGGAGSNSKTSLVIGTDGGTGYDGIVYELLYYSTVHGTTDRQTVENYLKAKYAL